MRGILLSITAGIAAWSNVPASAAAADPSYFRPAPTAFGQFNPAPDVRVHRGRDGGQWGGGQSGGGQWDGRDRDRHARYGSGDVYFPYRDYQGDTLWREGSFNDWWHDRPARAFPRWLGTNSNCERQYWTGSGWRC